MRILKRKGAVILVVLCLILSNTYGQKPVVVTGNEPGWKKIGETTASFKKQNESIHVLGVDEFKAIKLKVLDAPLTIERLQVFYESGKMEDIEVKNELKRNGESKIFNLKNPNDEISKIAFTYKTSPNYKGDKANVELYGLIADNEQSTSFREKAKAVGQDIDSAAEEIGDEVSEAAAKGAAAITDEKHETKVGPHGETIYIDDDNRYYYINNEGKKVYVSKMQLENKPNHK